MDQNKILTGHLDNLMGQIDILTGHLDKIDSSNSSKLTGQKLTGGGQHIAHHVVIVAVAAVVAVDTNPV